MGTSYTIFSFLGKLRRKFPLLDDVLNRIEDLDESENT